MARAGAAIGLRIEWLRLHDAITSVEHATGTRSSARTCSRVHPPTTRSCPAHCALSENCCPLKWARATRPPAAPERARWTTARRAACPHFSSCHRAGATSWCARMRPTASPRRLAARSGRGRRSAPELLRPGHRGSRPRCRTRDGSARPRSSYGTERRDRPTPRASHSRRCAGRTARAFREALIRGAQGCPASSIEVPNRWVGEGGLEPPHPFGHRHLKPARLPIPPLARVCEHERRGALCSGTL